MRRWIMAGAGLILVLTLGLGLRGTALAHAKLVSSIPKAGERLTTAPAKVTLVFSEEVSDQASETYFTVTNAQGATIGNGKLDNTDVDHKTASGTLQSSLDDGVYTVAWHAVTPDDNGISSGIFTFGVNADAGPQSNVAGTEQEEATAAPTTASTAAASTAQPTTAATVQVTAQTVGTAQPTATVAVTTTLPRTGDNGSSLPGSMLLLALVVLVGGFALRSMIARSRR